MATNDPTSAGTPTGMTGGDVEGRAELASYLGKEVWPADADALRAKAAEANAPGHLIGQLRSLPSGRQFANVSEVWAALSGGTEQQRF
jgi:hypothetical protein